MAGGLMLGVFGAVGATEIMATVDPVSMRQIWQQQYPQYARYMTDIREVNECIVRSALAPDAAHTAEMARELHQDPMEVGP